MNQRAVPTGKVRDLWVELEPNDSKSKKGDQKCYDLSIGIVSFTHIQKQN
jgi:hypothetical protein